MLFFLFGHIIYKSCMIHWFKSDKNKTKLLQNCFLTSNLCLFWINAKCLVWYTSENITTHGVKLITPHIVFTKKIHPKLAKMAHKSKRHLYAFTIITPELKRFASHYFGQAYKNIIKTRSTVPLELEVYSEKLYFLLQNLKICWFSLFLLIFLIFFSHFLNILSHSPYPGKEGGWFPE